jgi:hypothetical protein
VGICKNLENNKEKETRNYFFSFFFGECLHNFGHTAQALLEQRYDNFIVTNVHSGKQTLQTKEYQN